MSVFITGPYDRPASCIQEAITPKEQAPHLYAKVSQEGKVFDGYLPTGATSGSTWPYLTCLLTFPLFNTFQEAKITLGNRLFNHTCFSSKFDKAAGEKFSELMGLFSDNRSIKGTSFFPQSQIDAVIKLVQHSFPDLKTEDVVDMLFPRPVRDPEGNRDPRFPYLRNNEAGKLLHRIMMERLNEYRNQEIKSTLTEVKTAFCGLSILKGFTKLFEIVSLCWNTWTVKRKFETIYTEQVEKLIIAGCTLM